MTAQLEGRTALISGGGQGLGRAIAAEFLRAGATVALCGRNAGVLEAAQRELAPLAAAGRRVLVRVCDVSKAAEVDGLAAWVLSEEPALDILVNNAGVNGCKGLLEDNDWSEWVRTIEINLLGSVLLCRSLVPHLKRRGHGKIIQVSGGGATGPMAHFSAYAASKAAVVRFAETIAIELEPYGISVNSLAPGMLDTRMLDEVIAAGPELVGAEYYRKACRQKETGGASLANAAALALFLASSASDGITGRLISAVWDSWPALPVHQEELRSSDIYTVRRIVPGDRGRTW